MADAVKLVRTVAGSKFNIISIENSNIFLLEHVKCGHRFQRDLAQISMQGIKCSRCTQSSLGQTMMNDATDAKALRLYNQCKELVPTGFIIRGDTSNELNIVEVEDNYGTIHSIVIKDLLENNNLPDCLLRRDNSVVSPALSVLDAIARDCIVLDDFNTLQDVVRVKSCVDFSIKEMSVIELLKRKGFV